MRQMELDAEEFGGAQGNWAATCCTIAGSAWWWSQTSARIVRIRCGRREGCAWTPQMHATSKDKIGVTSKDKNRSEPPRMVIALGVHVPERGLILTASMTWYSYEGAVRIYDRDEGSNIRLIGLQASG